MANFMKYLSPISMMAGDRKDPAAAAQPFLNQIKQGYQPFQQAGADAMGTSQPIYNKMASDPMSMVNEIMSGYEQSPGSQYQQQRMSQQLANTAGAGGFRGTGMEGSQQAELLQGLLSGDMQQWLQNIMQTQGQGLQGLEQSTDRGYNATEGIGNVLDREGGMAAQGAVNSNERRAALMKALGQAAGMAVGGPMASGAGGHAMSGIFGGGNVQGSPEATQYGQQFGGRMAGDIFGAF